MPAVTVKNIPNKQQADRSIYMGSSCCHVPKANPPNAIRLKQRAARSNNGDFTSEDFYAD